MAVVNTTSPQVVLQAAGKDVGKAYAPPPLRLRAFEHVQGATAGDATSTQGLIYMPAGVGVVYGLALIWSAFGASRVLDVGYTAGTKYTDGSTVNASTEAFKADLDVSAAGSTFIPLISAFDFADDWLIQSVVAGGTIPANATIKGYVLFSI